MERFGLLLSAATAVTSNATPSRPTTEGSHSTRASKKTAGQSLTPESRPMDLSPTSPKDVEHLMSDVLYAINFAKMNHVFNRRIHFALNCITAVGIALGGVTGLGLFSKVDGLREYAPMWSLMWFAIGAVAAAVRHYGKFDDLAKKYLAARDEFIDLELKGWDMSAKELQAAFGKIEKKYPASGYWLADAAYNRTVVALNHPEHRVPVPFVRRALAETL